MPKIYCSFFVFSLVFCFIFFVWLVIMTLNQSMNGSILDTSMVMETVDNQVEMGFCCYNCSSPWDKDIIVPKILPHCGHSLCAECVQKATAETRSHIVCPECQETSRFSSRGPQGLKTNFEILKLAVRYRLQRTQNEENDEGDVCHHVMFTKTPLSCPHCSKKFCNSCEIIHKERLRDDALEIKRTFKERLDKQLETCDDLQVEVENFVVEKMNERIRQASDDCEKVRCRLNQMLDIRREQILNEIKSVGDCKIAQIREIVAKVKDASIPPRIDEIAQMSVRRIGLEEMAEMQQAAVDANERLSAVEKMKENIETAFFCYEENEEAVCKRLKEVEDVLSSVRPLIRWLSRECYEKELIENLTREWFAAVEGNDVEKLKTLLSKPELSDNARKAIVEHRETTEAGFTALIKAAFLGHLDVVRFLVEECGASMLARDEKSGNTACHEAAYANRLDVVQYLCERNPDFFKLGSGLNATPLHLAAGSGAVDVAKYLLENKEMIDLAARSISNRTVLHYAAGSGHANIVEMLLQSGCEPREVDIKGRTALHFAAKNNQNEAARVLLSHNPDLVLIKDSSNKTVLDYAHAKRDPELIKLFKHI